MIITLASWPRLRAGACALIGTLLLIARADAAVAPAPEGIEVLSRQLVALSRSVRPDEAKRLAAQAHLGSIGLARHYRPVGPPQFHNFLVNAGLKQRGLCHHWARDLGDRLAALRLRTLGLRWAIARGGTLREHNAVVVTARGQRFEDGIVLDAWRYSGQLYAGPVAGDKYPWKEDPADSFAASRQRRITR